MGGHARVKAVLTRSWRGIWERSSAWAFEPRRAAARHDVVAALAQRLLGNRDPAAILDETWLAVTQICQLTPGVRALAVTTTGASWRVTRSCGSFVRVPMTSSTTLPTPPAAPTMVERPLYDTYTFDVAAGQRCTWLAIFLPATDPPTWMIIGIPANTRRGGRGILAPLRIAAGLMSLALRHDTTQPDSPTRSGRTPSATVTSPAAGQPRQHENGDGEGDRTLDVAAITAAIRGVGDELLQQLSTHVNAGRPPTEADDAGEKLAHLASDMVDDITREVTQRLTAALAMTTARQSGPLAVGGPAQATTAPQTAPEAQHAVAQDVPPAADPADAEAATPPGQAGHDTAAADPTAHSGQDEALRFAAEELKSAVAADEIMVHYQPIMSASGDQCTGVEALARWQHPRHGLLSPAQFLNGADDTDGSRLVGAHVLRRAVAEGSKWQQRFPEQSIPVHVNVSADQLDDNTFATTVRDCLNESSLPAQALVLEITDRATALSPAARAQLSTVAADGVQIALSVDQVASSDKGMTTWQDLPISIVKLDGGAAAAADSSHDRPESIIDMARRLGLRTVAERVESTSQQNTLRKAGADSTQGYLHSHPISGEALTEWLSRRQSSAFA